MRRVLLCLAFTFFSFQAFAEVDGVDVDDILTNAKLRAESGSKSRFSVALQLNYSGGSVAQPFGESRPNIGAVTGTTPFTDIDGTVNLKFNIDSRDSLLFGAGVRWVTPFQGWASPQKYSIKKVDAFDPSFNYQRIYKMWGAQSYYQIGPTFYTRSDVVAEGYLYNLGLYNVNAWDVGDSGLTLGVETSITYGIYRNQVSATDDRTADEVRADQSDYNFAFDPYLEYKMNDTFNLRVACTLISFEHTRADDSSTWHHDTVTIAAGLGISLTRDFYLFPNILFLPDQIRPSDTNVGLTADINVF